MDYYSKAADRFAALSNNQRLEIYKKICDLTYCCFHDSQEKNSSEDRYNCCVGDISNTFNLSPATVSHHLKELKYAGLINMERKGRFIYLTPLQEPLKELNLFFERLLNS